MITISNDSPPSYITPSLQLGSWEYLRACQIVKIDKGIKRLTPGVEKRLTLKQTCSFELQEFLSICAFFVDTRR